jgi:hypothetical protein
VADVKPSSASAGALDRWTPGTQTISPLLEQCVTAGRGGYWYWSGLDRFSLDRLLCRNRHRCWDLEDRRLLGGLGVELLEGLGGGLLGGLGSRLLSRLGGEPGAAAHALFSISLAFLLGAFAGLL